MLFLEDEDNIDGTLDSATPDADHDHALPVWVWLFSLACMLASVSVSAFSPWGWAIAP